MGVWEIISYFIFFLWSLHHFKGVKIKKITPPPSLGWETWIRYQGWKKEWTQHASFLHILSLKKHLIYLRVWHYKNVCCLEKYLQIRVKSTYCLLNHNLWKKYWDIFLFYCKEKTKKNGTTKKDSNFSIKLGLYY